MTDRERYDEAVVRFLYRARELVGSDDPAAVSCASEAHDLLRRAPAPRKVRRHNQVRRQA